jgi:predicted adenylyl cyclase CyaB
MHINYEFKARVTALEVMESKLKLLEPVFKGEDHQLDTYFNVPNGRLKLREGNIEHALIWYERPDTAGAKQSNVILYQHQPDPALKHILASSLGIKTIVDKKRRIYFIDNVKFHFDRVEGLGTFVEVEAIDLAGDQGIEKLKDQCDRYAALFELQPDNYVANSYSDILLAAQAPPHH